MAQCLFLIKIKRPFGSIFKCYKMSKMKIKKKNASQWYRLHAKNIRWTKNKACQSTSILVDWNCNRLDNHKIKPKSILLNLPFSLSLNIHSRCVCFFFIFVINTHEFRFTFRTKGTQWKSDQIIRIKLPHLLLLLLFRVILVGSQGKSHHLI